MNAQRRQSMHEDRRQEMKRKEREREKARALKSYCTVSGRKVRGLNEGSWKLVGMRALDACFDRYHHET